VFEIGSRVWAILPAAISTLKGIEKILGSWLQYDECKPVGEKNKLASTE
jgi:hypothetical protein